MFNLHLYTVSSEVNRVDKSSELSEDFTIAGTLRDDCSIIDPTIIVAADTTIVNFNYAYVEEFKRYYFINNITALNNGMWELSMHVDALMSFKEGLLNCIAFIARNEKSSNDMIIDPLVPFENDVDITERIHPSVFTESSSMLMEQIHIVCNVVNNKNFAYNMSEDYATGGGVDDDINPLPSIASTGIGKQVETTICPHSNINGLFGLLMKEGSVLSTFVVSMFILPFRYKQERFLGFYPQGQGGFYFRWGNDGEFRFVNEFPGLGTANEKELEENCWYTTNNERWQDNIAGAGRAPMIYFEDDFDMSAVTDNYITWRSFEPYSKYELYVPYAGWIKLEARKLYSVYTSQTSIGRRLKIVWAIDPQNGIGTYKIVAYMSNTVKSIFMTSGSVQVLQPIPISYTTADNVERNKTANTISLVGNIIKSVGAIGGAAAVSVVHPFVGLGMGAGALSGLAGSISGYAANEATNVEYGGSSPVQSIAGNLYLPNRYIVRRYKVRTPFIEGVYYNALVGAPLKKAGPLREVHGFTTIDSIHLENFIATSSEKDEIMRKLLEGVILP